MPTIVEVNLIRSKHGAWSVVRPEDEAALTASEPYGYTRDTGKALLVDGRYYVLHTTVDAGIGEWSEAESEAAELALDAEVAPLTPKMRKLAGFSDWVPHPVRKARRRLDDARADKRAAKGAEAKAAADVAVQAARAALDAAKLAAGIVEPEPDER